LAGQIWLCEPHRPPAATRGNRHANRVPNPVRNRVRYPVPPPRRGCPRPALRSADGREARTAGERLQGAGQLGRRSLPALRRRNDLDEGVVALPGLPLQGRLLL